MESLIQVINKVDWEYLKLNQDNVEKAFERIKAQYFNVKLIGLILVDIVQYDDKGEMIKRFNTLFENNSHRLINDEIPDLKYQYTKYGISKKIGTIKNSKYTDLDTAQDIESNAEYSLPTFIQQIDIFLNQAIDYRYYINYQCLFHEDFTPIQKNKF